MRPRKVWTRAVTRAAAASALAVPAQAATEGGLQIFPDLRVFYLIAFFALLVFPVNRVLLRPLMRVLDERSERIEGAREHAERLRHEADSVLERYREAVRRAREEAEAERRETVEAARREHAEATTKARGDADQEVARAREEVQAALGDARARVHREAEALARDAASRVLGRSLA